MEQEDLYKKLAERIFMHGSRLIPELFRMIADEDEARLLLAMPGTAEQLAERTGKSVEEVEAMLSTLFRKGLVFKSQKPEGTIYRMCRDLVQFHDASILWPEAPREYHDLWKRYMEEEWPDFARIAAQLPKPFSRVIPVNQPVEAKQRILAYEDVERIIKEAGSVAVTKCTCRLVERKCDKPLEVCLQVGKAADYNVERGTGRKLTVEEALEIVRQAEEAGLVHVTMNRAEDTHFICNCCEDCCMSFSLIKKYGLLLCDPSRFRAEVDEGECSGCGTCVDRCPFEAIGLEDTASGEKAKVNPEKCMGCGLCVITCPEEALRLKEVRSPDFIPS